MPLFPFASDNSYTHLARVVKQMVSLGEKMKLTLLSGSANSVRMSANGCLSLCGPPIKQPRPLDVTLRQKPSLGRVSTLAVSGVLTFWAVQHISQREQEGSDWHTPLGRFTVTPSCQRLETSTVYSHPETLTKFCSANGNVTAATTAPTTTGRAHWGKAEANGATRVTRFANWGKTVFHQLRREPSVYWTYRTQKNTHQAKITLKNFFLFFCFQISLVSCHFLRKSSKGESKNLCGNTSNLVEHLRFVLLNSIYFRNSAPLHLFIYALFTFVC